MPTVPISLPFQPAPYETPEFKRVDAAVGLYVKKGELAQGFDNVSKLNGFVKEKMTGEQREAIMRHVRLQKSAEPLAVLMIISDWVAGLGNDAKQSLSVGVVVAACNYAYSSSVVDPLWMGAFGALTFFAGKSVYRVNEISGVVDKTLVDRDKRFEAVFKG